MRIHYFRKVTAALAVIAFVTTALAADNPFLGAWELTLPGPSAGWLGVTETSSQLQASVMWVAGSVEPAASAKMEDGKLVVERHQTVQRRGADGKRTRATITQTITATVNGNEMKLTSVKPRENGQGEEKIEFTGKRSPPMPPAPDLAKVQFGAPIELFNGKDLAGWRLTTPNAVSGWSAKDGILVNDARQEEGQPHKNYGNLRTDKEFEDFSLKLEVRIPKGGNSGIYMRGIYEVQVADNYGEPPSSHNIGGVYTRITPTENAGKPAGEWQTFDITFVKRHATVILNGKKIIDNKPVEGCTGGALWADVSRPGPIYLQGDHTSIEYRNIQLRPVVKE
jgi:hypothetical protein